MHVKLPYKDYETVKTPYNIKREDYGTKNFRAIFKISLPSGEEFATLTAHPLEQMHMDMDGGLLKIHNKFLYQKNFFTYVKELLRDLQLKFVNITRIDICYDFLSFDTMSVKEFINSISGETPDILKEKKIHISTEGESVSVDKGQYTGGTDTVTFGRRSSDMYYTLYNKTKELLDVKMKPYIHDHWRSHGWDGKASIYRLEFVFHSSTKGLVLDTGEVISFKDLSMIEHYIDMYRSYFSKCFKFVETEYTKKGNLKKQSRCTPVILFSELKIKPVIIELSDKKDSTRTDKSFINNLNKLNQELRGNDFELGLVGDTLISYVVASRDLKDWAAKKFNYNEYSFDNFGADTAEKKRTRDLFELLPDNLQQRIGKMRQLTMKF